MSRRGSRLRDFTDVHGILLLNKPSGLSSNQALQKARRILKANKAGHTGNLDPMATGLLPCCFGDATKVADLMINADKAYQAEALLGSQTDTGDATGKVIGQAVVPNITKTQAQVACDLLTGEIQQIPPMYSALNHQGQRLYQLARQGIEVDRKARTLQIHRFQCLHVNDQTDPVKVLFDVHCSKGTYIRTLIEDWAQKLNTLAHMSALHRTQSGIFKAADMVTLEQLEAQDNPQQLLLSMDSALQEYPQIDLLETATRDLIHGKQVATDGNDGLYRLYDQNGLFLGMGQVTEKYLKVHKLFMKSYQQNLQYQIPKS